ncbi:putative reverse transcriptase domain-containing protein [Tanacetum coccineum]|uniref:Reverse transcriptase domain-containing protein n=1 Tax=Tanacetum coccineum TaxID=301880 RepID=A0ABQ4XG48_9ASTR
MAYASRQLKVHEKNYTTHDLELGEILFILKIWGHYLYGMKRNMSTNHKSLQHILDQKELNMRPRRLLEFLSEFVCKIRCHPRNANVAADDVSRKEQVKPLRIIAKVGTVAYRLELPEKLSRVHSTFHISYLKKCLANEPFAIPLDEIQVDDKLHFIKEPVEIMDREVGDEAINEEMLDSVERAITTDASLDASQDSDNITKTQSTETLNEPHPQGEGSGHTSGNGEGRMEHQFELTANVPISPHDSPLPGGYTPGSDKGRLKLQELMTMYTKLSKQVLDLEKEKDTQAVEILRLKKIVKRLERQRKSSSSQPRKRKYG